MPDTDVPATNAERVTTLELFFDLVFVFTITQLTSVLVEDLDWPSVGEVACMLAVIWWMYGGYAWLTNNVAPTDARTRLVLLLGMAGYLVVALAIPEAYDDAGLAFGLGYLVVTLVHAGLFMRGAAEGTATAMRALAPYNVATAVTVLAGGALGGGAQVALWVAAPLCQWFLSGPLASRRARHEQAGLHFDVAPAHFVERHGLVVIVAIGESVVAVGIGAAGLEVDTELVLAAALGLAVSAGLWWTYFGDDDDAAAERALVACSPADRQRRALAAFGLPHLMLLLGIVVTACGLEQVIEHRGEELELAQALSLAGGVATFLVADAWFRQALGLGRSVWRAAVGLLVLATIPLGTQLAALAQLAVVAGVLVAMLALESRRQAIAVA
jgi:low temperature requirement protein LtrA